MKIRITVEEDCSHEPVEIVVDDQEVCEYPNEWGLTREDLIIMTANKAVEWLRETLKEEDS